MLIRRTDLVRFSERFGSSLVSRFEEIRIEETHDLWRCF